MSRSLVEGMLRTPLLNFVRITEAEGSTQDEVNFQDELFPSKFSSYLGLHGQYAQQRSCAG